MRLSRVLLLIFLLLLLLFLILIFIRLLLLAPSSSSADCCRGAHGDLVKTGGEVCGVELWPIRVLQGRRTDP
jgi:hypothetical protein